MKRMQGKKAVVTGAGGAMGEAIAGLLAQEGADVALNDRIAERLEPVEAKIRDLGVDVISVVGNVTKRAGATDLIATALERWDRIDVLINIVGGIKGPVVNPLLEITEDEWEITIGLNLRATFHCTQLVAPGMMKQRYGKVLNIASVCWAGEAVHAHYAAAKAGVVALTRSVATQLAPYNINVNAIAPGPTERGVSIELGDSTEPIRYSVSEVGPLGRPNEPSDIANAALFLVSEDSRNISGQLLTVAGGSNPSL